MLGLPSADEHGRESPRGPAAALFAADQASRGLGMELLHVGRGTAVVQMRVALQMLNGHSIGHGGFGEVYYAVSDGGKEVALKLIRQQSGNLSGDPVIDGHELRPDRGHLAIDCSKRH